MGRIRNDQIVDQSRLSEIAPKKQSVVHLGVCRSIPFVAPLKSNNSSVRVICSENRVDPEFFLRCFTKGIQYWRAQGNNYVDAHVQVRMSMLKELGVD